MQRKHFTRSDKYQNYKQNSIRFDKMTCFESLFDHKFYFLSYINPLPHVNVYGTLSIENQI